MEILGTVVSGLFGSAIGGSGLGLIGTVVGKTFGWLEQKEKNKTLLAQNAHELNLIQEQAKIKQVEMESEYMIAQMEADANIRTAAYQHDASYGETPMWCSSILRLVRPVVTLLLMGMSAYIYWKAYDFGDWTTTKMLAEEVVFMTSLAITFWFGSRPANRK